MKKRNYSHPPVESKIYGKPVFGRARAFSWLFLSLALCLFVSCSGDDNDGVVEMAKREIIGKWELVEWPGVDLSLSEYKEYYEFYGDNTYTHVVNTKADISQQTGSYTFEDGWSLNEGELEGYLKIENPGFGNNLYHCWLKKNTIIMADKEWESYENGIPFKCPFKTYQKNINK